MSEQLQLRRGTAAQNTANVPSQGEAWFATDTMRLHMGDGSTAGGWTLGLETRRGIPDVNSTVAITDRLLAYTSLTAPRTVQLPAASNYPVGARLTIADESGSCSSTNYLTINRAGSDNINGSLSAIVLAQPYGSVTLESSGSNGWTLVGPSPLQTVATSPFGANVSVGCLEFPVTGMSGASVIAGTQIPVGSILLAVGVRVTTLIVATGSPTGLNVGDQTAQGDASASATRFASNIAFTAGTVAYGLIAPTPITANTNILLAPAGGSSPAFSSGAVRLSIHYISCPYSAA